MNLTHFKFRFWAKNLKPDQESGRPKKPYFDHLFNMFLSELLKLMEPSSFPFGGEKNYSLGKNKDGAAFHLILYV